LIKLTLDAKLETPVEVTFDAEGYREEKVTLDLGNTAETTLQLVPAGSHVFVSKRSGKYDVYKIDADGKNEQKVLAGSGTERDDLVLVQHPTKAYAALVSTRENVRNADGFLLSTLTFIDLSNNTPTKVAQSEKIQIIDWMDDRLVYVQIASGASASDPKRHRLMSYDPATDQSKELASSRSGIPSFMLRHGLTPMKNTVSIRFRPMAPASKPSWQMRSGMFSAPITIN